MWIKDGQLYSAGSPQYGQLGHGSTHEYNTKDSSVKMAFEPQPTPNPIQAFAGKKVTKAGRGGTTHSSSRNSSGTESSPTIVG